MSIVFTKRVDSDWSKTRRLMLFGNVIILKALFKQAGSLNKGADHVKTYGGVGCVIGGGFNPALPPTDVADATSPLFIERVFGILGLSLIEDSVGAAEAEGVGRLTLEIIQ